MNLKEIINNTDRILSSKERNIFTFLLKYPYSFTVQLKTGHFLSFKYEDEKTLKENKEAFIKIYDVTNKNKSIK
jgi:hypothetical protein